MSIKIHFKKNLRILSQFNFGEKIIFLIVLILEKLIEHKRDEMLTVKAMIEAAYKYDGLAERKGNKNILSINNDPETGQYKIAVRRNGSDFPIYREIFYCKEHKALIDRINAEMGSHNVKYIVDAGANIGCATIYLKKKFPSAMVVAIEPEKMNYKMLLDNIKMNRFENVFPLNCGLWFDNSDLSIDGSRKRADRFMTKPNMNSSGEKVKAVTISDIMDKYSMPYIDILKMDIEGAERYLFENEDRVKTFLPRIRYMAIEIHDNAEIRDNILKLFIMLPWIQTTG